MDPITLALIAGLIALGGLLVGIGVHFVPVGGAPAAMAQATGIGTGTTMLAASSGFLGLISAGLVTAEVTGNPAIQKLPALDYPDFVNAFNAGTLLTVDSLSNTNVLMGIAIIVMAGIVGAMLMMVILAVMPNILYTLGLGVPLASAKVKKDPITGDVQYTSQIVK
jgi:tetrahydromethanopterin S-methyltransferase subunit D